MENRSSQLRSPGLIAAFVALLLALCALMCPAAAMADEESVAHSVDASGGITGYKTIEEALAAGYDGKTIYMDTDWKVEGITIEEGKNLKIDMYGHKIACTKGSASSVINIGKGAQLTLTSSQKAEFWYRSFSGLDGSASYSLTSTGGLVTNGDQQNVEDIKFTGIEVGENATLSLDGVTIAGCYGDDEEDDNRPGGGITMRKFSTLNMVNGATIEGNKSRMHGAGVYVAGSDSTVNIDNSSISRNYSCERGGGIGISGHRVVVNMSNDAHIDNNSAQAGGGIICFSASCTLRSVDGKATVSGNRALSSNRTTVKWAQSGGGIHITGTSEENPNVLIENITIADNYSAYDGGGLELDYKGVTLRNCIITGNTCKYEGGGIYVCDDGETIDGCTITGNACSVDSGGNYEGGGVFVWHSYDIKLAGKCIIKGNTRGKGTDNADDVMLREDWWTSTKAYITGSLEKGSSVGVRTGTTGDRRIAKNFKPDTKDCLFYDMDGYYISYGNDNNGDAWQRHRETEFLAQVNGLGNTRYKQGAAVALSGALQGTDAVFWYWDATSTAGLNPVSDYITKQNACNPILSFNMPQNAVDARAVYATRVKKVLLAVDAPEAGEPLPSTAVLVRNDGGYGGNVELKVPVTWYEVDGERKSIAAGTAKGGTVYTASVSCSQLPQIGLYFSQGISAQDVTVRPSSGSDAAASSASVDASTGTLMIETDAFAKTDDASGTVAIDTATVKLEGDSLASVIGGGPSGASAASELSDEPQASRSPLGELSVSYTKDGTGISIAAPAKDGYNFCNWENVEEGWVSDDVEGIVTVPAADVERISGLVAVYTPVVTEVEVGLSSPVAAQSLDKSVTKLLLKGSNGEQIELVDAIGDGSLPVVWSPGAEEDGTANYSTAYAALVQIDDGEGYEGVEDVLAPNAVVKVNGGGQAASASFTVADGKLCLALSFEETRAVKATAVTAPEDVELTFEEAAACQAEQEGNPDENCWPLGRIAVIALENGEAADGDITWEAVTGFDPDATTAQELTVKGTFEVAYCDEVDDSGISHEVTCKIKIAAPSQGGGEDGGDTPDVNPNDGNGQPESGDAAGTSANADKQALAKTGDSIPVLAVAAVVAIAIAAIAVAIVAARRSRRQ